MSASLGILHSCAQVDMHVKSCLCERVGVRERIQG
jgi:hypothetical protein